MYKCTPSEVEKRLWNIKKTYLKDPYVIMATIGSESLGKFFSLKCKTNDITLSLTYPYTRLLSLAYISISIKCLVICA